MQVFDLEPEECLRISAKTGKGLDALLPAIVEKIPPPGGKPDGELRMLLFDAVHDDYRSFSFQTVSVINFSGENRPCQY